MLHQLAKAKVQVTSGEWESVILSPSAISKKTQNQNIDTRFQCQTQHIADVLDIWIWCLKYKIYCTQKLMGNTVCQS